MRGEGGGALLEHHRLPGRGALGEERDGEVGERDDDGPDLDDPAVRLGVVEPRLPEDLADGIQVLLDPVAVHLAGCPVDVEVGDPEGDPEHRRVPWELPGGPALEAGQAVEEESEGLRAREHECLQLGRRNGTPFLGSCQDFFSQKTSKSANFKNFLVA